MTRIDPIHLDPAQMKDWEIAQAAEESLTPITTLAEAIGIGPDELHPYGHHTGKVDYLSLLDRLKGEPEGKYVDVTAITPTPLGEGKTTTTIGLVDGLASLGYTTTGAIRQPSGGPTFNIKGSAAGGGLSQCLPLTELSLGLTGDIDAITNAHNLAMVALTSRLQHEFNYSDKALAKRGLERLNIDPYNPAMGWAIDFSAQALREIIMGIGGKLDGFMMKSGFQITVSSEVMAILSVARNITDMRERMGRMVIGYNRKGAPVTAEDLEVAGAMTAIMHKAINPNLMQTVEHNPLFVHAGPFANIAIGQSSIVADRLGVKLGDYHVTESGFGADIGYEKFWNLKCRFSGLVPDAAVIVCTIRALKMHGGGPTVVAGRPLAPEYSQSHPALVEAGTENLRAHIETVRRSGVPAVVCINSFPTDTEEEIRIVRDAAEAAGARVAVSRHWAQGGRGAQELAQEVERACEEPPSFEYLYSAEQPLKDRIERIATQVYGADGVTYTPEAEEKIAAASEDPELSQLATCMVKTQYSLSHDAERKGRPRGWTLPIHDLLAYRGAGFLVPVAGDIKLMPGTSSTPAFRNIDVDTETGKVQGLF